MPQVLSRLQSHGHSYIQDESGSKEAELLNAKHESVKKIAHNELEDPNRLIISGYLNKKSARYHNYKRKWFVLRNCQLSYYKDESEHKPLGVIQGMNLLSVNVDDTDTHHHRSKFYFKIHTNEKVLQLYVDNKEVLNKWVKALQSAIEYNCNDTNDIEKTADANSKPSLLEPPPQSFLDHNNSSVEQFSGADDANYTSNASDNNANQLSSSLPQITLPAINENKLDHLKVETEREKLRTKLLNRKLSEEGDENTTTQDSKTQLSKVSIDTLLSRDYDQEIVIEKGQMSRLYKRYNQWKKFFIILTNKNMLFYKYSSSLQGIAIPEDFLKREHPSKTIKTHEILDVVEIDALSKSKPWCLLIITKEKRLRFSVESEDELIKWLVAITLFTNRRKEKQID